jgi:hypothetical protein
LSVKKKIFLGNSEKLKQGGLWHNILREAMVKKKCLAIDDKIL